MGSNEDPSQPRPLGEIESESGRDLISRERLVEVLLEAQAVGSPWTRLVGNSHLAAVLVRRLMGTIQLRVEFDEPTPLRIQGHLVGEAPGELRKRAASVGLVSSPQVEID